MSHPHYTIDAEWARKVEAFIELSAALVRMPDHAPDNEHAEARWQRVMRRWDAALKELHGE